MLHSGAEDQALDLAKAMIEAFADGDYIAVNAAAIELVDHSIRGVAATAFGLRRPAG